MVLAAGGLLGAQAARAAGPAAATQGVEFFDEQRQDFVNTDCQHNGTCGLKKFSLVTDTYKVNLPGVSPTWGTRMLAIYETGDIPQVEDYGIAQFIKGCMYTSELVDGKVRKEFSIVRQYYGQSVTFRHPAWVIDGVVRDPIDWAYDAPAPFRHYYYQWTPRPDALDLKTAKYFGHAPPQNPVLFVKDEPGVAFLDDGSGVAKNISLHFRTCIYKSKDVPQDVDYDRLDFAVPIHCFEWGSSFVYDHNLRKFQSPPDIDPVCL